MRSVTSRCLHTRLRARTVQPDSACLPVTDNLIIKRLVGNLILSSNDLLLSLLLK